MISFLLIVMLTPTTTLAYATFNNHKSIVGVGNYGNNRLYYFIGGTATSEAAIIDSAMNKWVNSNGTGMYTPISYRRTYTQSSATIDIWNTSYNDGVAVGSTNFFIGSSVVSPYSTNWYWNEVYLHPLYRSSSAFVKNNVVAHELGHCFGLDHSGNRAHLMYKTTATTANGPTRDEFYGIKSLY